MTVVAIEDMKAHLNVTDDADDELITAKIEAAEAWIGKFIGAELDDDTPEPVKEGVRQLVAHLYENREATLVGISMTDVSPGLFDLIAPYREYVF